MISYEMFRRVLSSVKTVSTATGSATYQDITIDADNMLLKKSGTGREETINLRELYKVYENLNHIDSNSVKKYITNRVFSPAVAVLIASGLYNAAGFRQSVMRSGGAPVAGSTSRQNRQKENEEAPEDMKDEIRFFRAFQTLIGKDYLYAKSLGMMLPGNVVIVSRDYRLCGLPENIVSSFESIMKNLGSDGEPGTGSLVPFIDGFISAHPNLGSRIVEFDEEQHFTPARKETLERLKGQVDVPYFETYLALCNDLEYLNNKVLRKSRITQELESMPEDFENFRKWMEAQGLRDSGYIRARTGFPFMGGRIAQRAYYDALRDVAHLMEPNAQKIQPAIRISKFQVEQLAGKPYDSIQQENMVEIINGIIEKEYGVVSGENTF